jgi:cytidine deaminase
MSRDASFIASTRALLAQTPRPLQSDFLVAATVLYTDSSGAERVSLGVNSETCVITSCICAERAALLAIRAAPHGWRRVTDVFITSTARSGVLVTPGLLCREFMCEYSGASAAVRERLQAVLAGGGGAGSGDARDDDIRLSLVSGDGSGEPLVTSLFALYPHRSRFHGVPRAALSAVGARGGRAAAPVSAAALLAAPLPAGAAALSLQSAAALERAYAAALDCARTRATGDDLFPLHFSAAFCVDGGGDACAVRGVACLEFGCSLDAVASLSGLLTRAVPRPRAICVVDQWGVLCAPAAPARAWLAEHGWGDLLIPLHDTRGALIVVTAADLSPASPQISLGALEAGACGCARDACGLCENARACGACGTNCGGCGRRLCAECAVAVKGGAGCLGCAM